MNAWEEHQEQVRNSPGYTPDSWASLFSAEAHAWDWKQEHGSSDSLMADTEEVSE